MHAPPAQHALEPPPPASRRRLARAALPVVGFVWALCMVVLGLKLFELGFRPARPAPLTLTAAVFFTCAGQFVFMVLVADRAVRCRRPALIQGVELAVGGASLAAFLSLILVWQAT